LSNTGGAGGANTGGVATGGTNTGGAATGGTNTGGVSTGGTSTGGVSTGGTSTGGANTGGTSTGGSSSCGTGQALCSSSCIDVSYDSSNCGACSAQCASGAWCDTQHCRCPDSELVCGGICTWVLNDNNNCGLCGIKCQGTQRCNNGTCVCDSGTFCGGTCRTPTECANLGTGGTGTGGTSSGGTGGVSTGGTNSGGTGGISTGGTNSGGTGGISTGGTSSGGTGGVSTGGTGGTSTGGSGGGTNAEFCGTAALKTGHATWYTLATPTVNCSYPTSTLPQYYGAINEAQYSGSATCGACVEVHSGGKTLTVQIVDQCPYAGNEQWCYAGSNHIDLNPAAFTYFAAQSVGVIDIQWRYVPCVVTGKIQYTFKSGSSIYWTAVMIRNYPVPITKVEYKNASGVWKSLARQSYNFWLDAAGFGQGPYSLRVTDVTGAVVQQDNIPSLSGTSLGSDQASSGTVQFPGCK
jgi:expansin (peptidoglycan-binding protein)